MVSPDKSLGELDYYQHIRTAVQSKNYEQALAWVKAAEQAGFTKAKEVFLPPSSSIPSPGKAHHRLSPPGETGILTC